MGKIKFDTKLKNEYEKLFKECKIKKEKLDLIDSRINSILTHKDRYISIAKKLGIPWYLIAVIHNMESGGNFNRHLHNGDPLTARTVHFPPNRPIKGTPPFSWEESAIDALKMMGLDRIKEWNLGRILYEMERYNGWGYRIHHINSPYLWSCSDCYKSGKYVADGIFDRDAVSKQCGGAVLLKRMEERGVINLSNSYLSENTTINSSKNNTEYPIFRYDDINYNPDIEKLQQFMNGFSDINLVIDGKAGPKTSDAFRELFGYYLYGDPRIFEEDSQEGVL